MFRIPLTALPVVAMLWSTTAIADLVIDIPDVSVFTISDPIISDEDVFINALPTTELIIDAPITAPNLTVTAGVVTLNDLIDVDGNISINASNGGVTLPTPGLDAPDIVISVPPSTASGSGITVSSGGGVVPNVTQVSGDISLGGSTGADVVTTNLDLTDANGLDLGSVTVTTSSPLTVNSVTVVDAAGTKTVTAATNLDTVEVPIAVVETNVGQLLIPAEASGLPALETDLGGGGLATDTFRSNDFAQKLFSCPQSEPDARFDEGSCAWAVAEISRLESDASAGDFDDITHAFALGAQTKIAPDIFAGAALGYESSDTDTSATSRTTDRVRGGLSLKYDDGAASLGLVIAGGYGTVDTTRLASGTVVNGSTDALNAEVRVRLAYGMTFGTFAVEPSLALSLLHSQQDGYAESGPALVARTLDDADSTTFGVHPTITIGTDLLVGPFSTRIRPELSFGLDWFSDPDFRLTGTAATGRPLFQTVMPDRLSGTVAAGLTLFASDDVALRLNYAGRFGENTTGHGGAVKLSLGF